MTQLPITPTLSAMPRDLCREIAKRYRDSRAALRMAEHRWIRTDPARVEIEAEFDLVSGVYHRMRLNTGRTKNV